MTTENRRKIIHLTGYCTPTSRKYYAGSCKHFQICSDAPLLCSWDVGLVQHVLPSSEWDELILFWRVMMLTALRRAVCRLKQYGPIEYNHHVICDELTAQDWSTIGDRAFPVADARVWNSLSLALTQSSSLTSFKRRLYSILLDSILTFSCMCVINVLFRHKWQICHRQLCQSRYYTILQCRSLVSNCMWPTLAGDYLDWTTVVFRKPTLEFIRTRQSCWPTISGEPLDWDAINRATYLTCRRSRAFVRSSSFVSDDSWPLSSSAWQLTTHQENIAQ